MILKINVNINNVQEKSRKLPKKKIYTQSAHEDHADVVSCSSRITECACVWLLL